MPEQINHIDEDNLREYAALQTFDAAKVVLCGKDILTRDDIIQKLGEPLTEVKKDYWFKTSYRIYSKPTNLHEYITAAKMQEAIANLHMP